MHIKVYFDDKPLFLCDGISDDLQSYRQHDDAVFIDDFSSKAVNAMLHEMRSQKVHAGIFLHDSLEALKKAVWKKFTVLQAAGGLVLNEHGEILFIFRRGKWDLPKGKLDAGESLEDCAIREVREETGLSDIRLQEYLVTTFHTYEESGRHILKESYWYLMRSQTGEPLTPQESEQITQARWVKPEELAEVSGNTFPSIIDVLRSFNLPV